MVRMIAFLLIALGSAACAKTDGLASNSKEEMIIGKWTCLNEADGMPGSRKYTATGLFFADDKVMVPLPEGTTISTKVTGEWRIEAEIFFDTVNDIQVVDANATSREVTEKERNAIKSSYQGLLTSGFEDHPTSTSEIKELTEFSLVLTDQKTGASTRCERDS